LYGYSHLDKGIIEGNEYFYVTPPGGGARGEYKVVVYRNNRAIGSKLFDGELF